MKRQEMEIWQQGFLIYHLFDKMVGFFFLFCFMTFVDDYLSYVQIVGLGKCSLLLKITLVIRFPQLVQPKLISG